MHNEYTAGRHISNKFLKEVGKRVKDISEGQYNIENLYH